ncbi:MAG: hypothetical protein PUI94_01485 [Eubacteriales bacterium]|nr:hypothetical protein [Eubacteriales bacterium]
MKKFVALLISIVTVLTLAACGKKNNSEIDWAKTSLKSSYTIGAVEGAPTLSLVNVADGGFTYTDNNKSVTTDVTVAADATAVVANLINGTYDMAILPINNAAEIYDNSGKHEFRLATVNVFGVLYMIGKEDIAENMNNLKGEVVYCVGFGGTPGLVLKHLLEKNGISYEVGDNATDKDKVYIYPVAGGQEVIQGLNGGATKFAVLGEPAVTQVSGKTGASVVLDFKKEWQKFHGANSTFTQAGLVVNVNKVNKKYVEALVGHLKGNKAYLYANTDKIPAKLTSMGSTGPISKLTYNETILDRCSSDCKTATSMRANIEAFLAANNVELPGGSFYCL